jgi:hypothetical protein
MASEAWGIPVCGRGVLRLRAVTGLLLAFLVVPGTSFVQVAEPRERWPLVEPGKPGDEHGGPLAGRKAGEGRPRPGRALSEAVPVRGGGDEAVPTPTSPGFPGRDPGEEVGEAGEDHTADVPRASATAAPQASGPARASGQVLEVLPFGAGLALIGLGIGFVGLRLRNR